ncbi:pyocin knob domain-containing protein [Paracoccus jiaweipingae]|uniref:pyocin knob domain-containing protein n=1 Tax=unclassified Paracoccus (in: a-proteobacteria) TaxID=2688777 RepID=UPI0037A6FB53
MADLPESADWVDGIYQIETTDPVVGGPPNLALGQGISNVQAQQLAQRTSYLKSAINGLGGEAGGVPGADLDALTGSGAYRIAIGDNASPASTYEGALQHVEGANGIAWQVAFMSNGRSYTRHRTDATPTWTAWALAWSEASATFSAGLSGYQIFPSGLIMQWGQLGTSGGVGQVTFPIAFPNVCRVVVVGDNANSTDLTNVHISSQGDRTNTGVKLYALKPDGSPVASVVQYVAIGD